MTAFGFDWHGLRMEARCSGALWWPAARWLIVGDLHLGKSERMARRGGALLPPYETAETLRRLRDEIETLDPAQVVSLGDSFDDDAAVGGLDEDVVHELARLAEGRAWLWIAGNHDPRAGTSALPGKTANEAHAAQVVLRHIASDDGPDISGHFHPVVRLAGARRRAFLIGPNHLILPAFGCYTGGLDSDHPAVAPLVYGGFAVACAHRALPVPLRRSRVAQV